MPVGVICTIGSMSARLVVVVSSRFEVQVSNFLSSSWPLIIRNALHARRAKPAHADVVTHKAKRSGGEDCIDNLQKRLKKSYEMPCFDAEINDAGGELVA